MMYSILSPDEPGVHENCQGPPFEKLTRAAYFMYYWRMQAGCVVIKPQKMYISTVSLCNKNPIICWPKSHEITALWPCIVLQSGQLRQSNQLSMSYSDFFHVNAVPHPKHKMVLNLPHSSPTCSDHCVFQSSLMKKASNVYVGFIQGTIGKASPLASSSFLLSLFCHTFGKLTFPLWYRDVRAAENIYPCTSVYTSIAVHRSHTFPSSNMVTSNTLSHLTAHSV